jgi:predicted RecA/RadA family phage recombinase
MKNYVQPGRTVTVPAPYAVESGWLVLLGDLVGIVARDAEMGEPCDLALEGCFSLPKASADVITAGQLVGWDSTASQVTTVESEMDALIGHAVEAAGSGVGLITVRLSN